MRISIRGVSCSGKTSLAKRLSKELNIQHIELDELYWLPEWKARNLTEFLKLVSSQLESESWVMDGNYSKVYNNLNPQYDYLIWLDYPFFKIMWRYFKRTFDRIIFKRKICNGNIENLKNLFSSDSLLIWIFKTYWKRKRELAKLIEENDKSLLVIRNTNHIKQVINMLKDKNIR